ncbi:MAG: phosphoribosyltransferase [Sulfolobales archaeon]
MSLTDEFMVLTWEDVFSRIRTLSKKIYSSGYIPDAILGIFRNGWIISRLLGDLLGVDEIGGIGIKFYRGVGETRERPLVTSGATINIRDLRILLVDDVSDSGRTLQVAVDLARLYGAREVRTATLYIKKKTMLIPDYFVEEVDRWIVFPWEYGEVIRELALKRYGDLSISSIKKVSDSLNIHDEELINIIYESHITKIRRKI